MRLFSDKKKVVTIHIELKIRTFLVESAKRE